MSRITFLTPRSLQSIVVVASTFLRRGETFLVRWKTRRARFIFGRPHLAGASFSLSFLSSRILKNRRRTAFYMITGSVSPRHYNTARALNPNFMPRRAKLHNFVSGGIFEDVKPASHDPNLRTSGAHDDDESH